MKITKEQIKNIDIFGYINWLVDLPYNMMASAYEMASNKGEIDNLALRSWRWSYSLSMSEYINSNRVDKFSILCDNKIKELEKRNEELETALRFFPDLFLAVADLSEYEKLSSLSDLEKVDFLREKKIISYAKLYKELFDSFLSELQNEYLEKSRFNSNTFAYEIDNLSNREFKYLDYLLDCRPCGGFYLGIKCDALNEFAELAYYHELVNDEINDTVNDKKGVSMLQKMQKLKDIGFFDLPYFSDKNAYDGSYIRSDNEVCIFLSDITGCHKDNLRKQIRRFRKLGK